MYKIKIMSQIVKKFKTSKKKKKSEDELSFMSEEESESSILEERIDEEALLAVNFFDDPDSETDDDDEPEKEKTDYSEYSKKVIDLPSALSGLHPAEIAAMYPIAKDGKIGGSDEQILKDLRRLVFSVPLMPHSIVKETFLGLDKVMFPIVHEVIETSSYFHEEVAQIIIKVAAGNTYGKNIYEKEEKDPNASEETPTERSLYKDHEIDFLINGYDLLMSLTTDRNDKHYSVNVPVSIEKCLFIRGVYEDVLKGFITSTEDLDRLHWQAFHARSNGQSDEYNKYISVIKTIEDRLGLKGSYFGLIRRSRQVYNEFQNVRSKVIAPYLRSVYSTAKNTAKNAHQMLDNFQNGSIGLMRAVSCYSTRRVASFHSVAKWWIKQMMLLSIKEDANFVKLPVSTWQSYTQLEKAKNKVGAQDDDVDAIAKAANISPKKAKAVYDTVKIAQVYSLNRTYDQDEKLSLEDIMTNENKIGYEGDDITAFLRDYCKLAELSTTENRVLALKHGMLDLIEIQDVPNEEVLREAFAQNLATLGYNYKPS
jgi:RNA polymerase sigma factor (sigma-70 family)